jgi:hypothetical protein
MRPLILIVETRPEVAAALEEVVTSARYEAIVRPHVACLSDLDVTPDAIIVRIASEGIGEPAHAGIARLSKRPPIVAIAWEAQEVEEAIRLGCEVVLKAPDDVGRLCEALSTVTGAGPASRSMGMRPTAAAMLHSRAPIR